MPNWFIKSAIHRAISWLPRPQFWNEILQTHVTRSLDLTTAMFEAKLDECRRFFDSHRAQRPAGGDFVALELGTGWYPTIPLGLYLCGARETHTIDIDALLRAPRIRRVLELLLECARSGAIATLLPACLPERVKALESLLRDVDTEPPTALLARIGVKVIVADAQSIPLSDDSVDFTFSSGVLEYIPPGVLENILAEFHRVSRRSATTAHRINLVDQYSYFDRSITAFNYLKYTAAQWNRLNSPLIFQNRLRLSDYKRLITKAGFTIAQEENSAGVEQELASVALAPEFRHYDRKDLLVLHSYLAGRACKAESHA